MINRRIRWIGFVLLACFVLLFLQLNNFQVRQAQSLVNNPDNAQSQPNPWLLPRGDIYSADNVVLAYSKATKDGLGELRIYPAATANLFAGITGYNSVADESATGLESEYFSYLSQHDSPATTLGQVLTEHKTTDDVIVTVSTALQETAAAALGGRTGAVVAIDPQTGAILAMYGNPTFDPNLFAVHNANAVNRSYNELVNTGALINYATGQARAPGSTFKVVDSAAIYDHAPQIANHSFPSVRSIILPLTANVPLYNFAGEYCGGNLTQVFAHSCDTSFALVGQSLGAQKLYDEAASFGFDSVPPLDLPPGEVAPSNFPTPAEIGGDVPSLMKSAIGQENVTATTLEMALVAAGIANSGVIMAPHLMRQIIDDTGNVVATYHPHVWKRATSAKTAQAVRTLMLGVTENPLGTAYDLFPSYQFPPVAAKTGTAQILATGCGTYNWLIATAPAGPGQTPTVAVAAIVPIPPGGSCIDVTGAQEAGPVVKQVLLKALELQQ
jgi:peptidoglycan glycosyltransferase